MHGQYSSMPQVHTVDYRTEQRFERLNTVAGVHSSSDILFNVVRTKMIMRYTTLTHE